MLDSNVFDHIVANDAVKAKVQTAVREGKIRIITTHIQEDELAEIPNKKRKIFRRSAAK